MQKIKNTETLVGVRTGDLITNKIKKASKITYKK